MPSEPKRKSWSNLPIRWALRSMWKSLSCHRVWATAWEKERPLIGLVGELGVQPDHLGMLQRADEGEGVADGGEEDVAPRLVGLGLEGDAQTRGPASRCARR